MPFDRINSDVLSLVVDGKAIDIKVASRRNFDLNKALLDADNFKDFIKDPRAFASRFDFTIDRDISDQLSNKLRGFESLEQLDRMRDPSQVATTLWAVAAGSYSVASAKVAVAF